MEEAAREEARQLEQEGIDHHIEDAQRDDRKGNRKCLRQRLDRHVDEGEHQGEGEGADEAAPHGLKARDEYGSHGDGDGRHDPAAKKAHRGHGSSLRVCCHNDIPTGCRMVARCAPSIARSITLECG
ncbi:hypothetical protein HMPREF1316_0063 [Olsenella profusa F0195]|uniref:Uncharacterized protein n=1 Tax=Olsenella profusa F0195 TaxID=1125712 RepID=U2T5R3_9ACTN|nr:hypothetical protein HMPREF1316_0063 [Olsenella profusa F0195]